MRDRGGEEGREREQREEDTYWSETGNLDQWLKVLHLAGFVEVLSETAYTHMHNEP